MTLLEISNRVEARPLIEQIEIDYRSFAPNVMLYVSLKGVIGVILNIVILFFATLSGWEVVDSSKRKAALAYVTQESKKTKQLTTVL